MFQRVLECGQDDVMGLTITAGATDRLLPLPLFSKWTSDRLFIELPLEHLLKSIICFQNDCCRRLSSKHSPQMGLECLVNLDLKKALPLKCVSNYI